MLFKKLFLFILIASSANTIQAASNHEIRTWGVVTAGVLVTWAGIHVLIRQNQDISSRMFDTIMGLALIAAGISGIVMSEKITRHIEYALN